MAQHTIPTSAGVVVAQVRVRLLRLADLAGTVTRSVPGVAGALMLSWGLGLAWRPLLWISLGVFALAIDRQMP